MSYYCRREQRQYDTTGKFFTFWARGEKRRGKLIRVSRGRRDGPVGSKLPRSSREEENIKKTADSPMLAAAGASFRESETATRRETVTPSGPSDQLEPTMRACVRAEPSTPPIETRQKRQKFWPRVSSIVIAGLLPCFSPCAPRHTDGALIDRQQCHDGFARAAHGSVATSGYPPVRCRNGRQDKGCV